MTVSRIIRTEPFREEFRFHAEVDGRIVARDFTSYEAARQACRDAGHRFTRDGEPEFVIDRFFFGEAR